MSLFPAGAKQPPVGTDPELLNRLSSVLPRNALLIGDAIDARYREDRRGKYSAPPRFVMRPGSTEEVSACLAACNDFAQPLVVHGGRTGLSGGHRIVEGEAVLSLERMMALDEVHGQSATIMASAGTPLQTVQEAADRAGFLFGVDIGSRGTATIGGNIATNAGGIRVLRYGMFRAQVAGLETVLADGTILSSLRGLDKDNTGYDLNQLFVGSEGTLGVVTRARLRLHPKPFSEANAFLAVPSLEAALQLLRRLQETLGPSLSAYELMYPEAYEGVVAFLGMPRPLGTEASLYVLAEVQALRDDVPVETFASCLMQALEDGVALDAVVSQSPREFQALWTMRDSCADFVRSRAHVVGCDISVPTHRIAEFLEAARTALRAIDPSIEFIVFGHLGDGNLHYVIRTPKGEEAAEKAYRLVAEHGGSISAEHGIGFDKKPWLHLCRSQAEIAAMRGLKTALDPKAILNRGRVFD
ncbi:FAD-binding oxidoreductase [Bradyrhizobium sp. LMTR 3]|uniref:FAD-binding oxidoreductase n=1 Tax=Bradyrhizobium sp. LMTR 3 TaxID=189873 RepID=UPI0008104C4F|nr:FAD-binding oxidoreductase [Bradyrhizobium sp. LMTR 3]OCK60720.1 FAD-dependent oxidoreductase [Bradyrhizobium sp. LMTR 3]